MKPGFAIITKTVKDFWINVFWKNPDHLWALKVTVSVAFLLIPAGLILRDFFFGTTMALGVVAMAIGETDVHPRGRLKSVSIALVLYFITSSLVVLFLPKPFLFGFILASLSFTLMIMGGIDSRMQGIAFGTMLILVYTMLGADNSAKWFYLPVLQVAGALCYSVISILLLYHRPYRLLEVHLARGFHYLAEYVEQKANLFPSKQQEQVQIRNLLAQKNIDLAYQIESCKSDLYSYSEENGGRAMPMMDYYYRKWFLLQVMQERAISSHEPYDILSGQVKNNELMDGFGQLMRELASAIHLYGDSQLTDQPYRRPLSLKWTLSALQSMLETEKDEPYYLTLSLLMRNLEGLDEALCEEEKAVAPIDVTMFHARKPEKNSLRTLLNPSHPRFRFAVRLTLTWLMGYGIMFFLHFEKEAWILMTSLIVFQQTYSATRLRLFHRIYGTLFGVVVAVILARLLPTSSGQILLLLASIYLFFYKLKQNYTVAVIFITVFVLAAFNLFSNQGVAVMFPRIIDTLVGGALTFLTVCFLWPDWQYKQLPVLMLTAVIKNRRYFESIYDGSTSEEEYLHNRRTAYNADNALTSSWKWMRLEPKNRRRYQDEAFNLTNLNHALLSYISAFGVHRSTGGVSEKEYALCSDVSCVLGLVSEMLTHKVNEIEMEDFHQKAKHWYEQVEKMMDDTTNQRVRLIYNIARVAHALLIETKEIEIAAH